VKDNRVVISVDGIHQEWSEHQRQIHNFLEGQSSVGADVHQPVIGIHEGASKNILQDIWRITKVKGMIQLLHSGLVPLAWAEKKMYKIDPAIKSVHDEVEQSLLAGRKVQLMTHSGGGTEAAAALALLSKEGMRDQIGRDVRLLSIASAAAHKDFTNAGLKSENIYYTGSKKDPVYYMFRHYMSPLSLGSDLAFGIDVARYALSFLHKDPKELYYHSPDYIFAQNMSPEGQRIQKFLDGGAGGQYPL
jgi:hypothetical protein